MPNFDSVGFLAALHRAAAARCKTMKDVSVETGVSQTTLSSMANGSRMCDAASLAALSAWAGINPARFSTVRRRPRIENTATNVRLRSAIHKG